MRIDPEQILSLLRRVRRPDSKGNVRSECPFCGQDEFYINIEKENYPFQCWRKSKCGESGFLPKLLKELGETSLLDNLNTVNLENKLELLVFDSIQKNEDIDLSIKAESLPLGFKRVYEDAYATSRGITDFKKYIVGYTNLTTRLRKYIVVAITQDEAVCGYIARDTTGQQQPKYLNSITAFSKILFGFDEINGATETLIVVEGLFDKINIENLLGLDKQHEIKCVCTFGCKVSDEQLHRIKEKTMVKTLILMYDNDVHRMITKAYNKTSPHFESVMIANIPYFDVDAGDISAKQLQTVLSDHIITGETYISNTIKANKLA